MRAGIEGGGTKFVCTVGTGPDDLRATTTVPTTTPDETLGSVIAFLQEQDERGPAIEGLGVASFGPVDLRGDSPTYGSITTTPKPGWAGTDVVGRLRKAFDVPIAFDTDVNGAAYGEQRWGATRGLRTSVYVTVGTGIGGGAVVEGRPLHGLLHPEMGHLLVRRHPDDPHTGSCPYHGDCLEGLASGPAIRDRYGRPADQLGDDLPGAIDLVSSYLGQMAAATVVILSPERMVFGGGVMNLPGLIEAVRQRTVDYLGGYVAAAALSEGIDDYIVPPGLGGRSGILGALALAEDIAEGHGDARRIQDAARAGGPSATSVG